MIRAVDLDQVTVWVQPILLNSIMGPWYFLYITIRDVQLGGSLKYTTGNFGLIDI